MNEWSRGRYCSGDYVIMISGAYHCGNKFLWGDASVQRKESDSITGWWIQRFACREVNGLLYVWVGCWCNWWVAGSWWRIHLGATFHWTRNSSSGIRFIIIIIFFFFSSSSTWNSLSFTTTFHQARSQVLHPLLQWRFLHPCPWWNITFSNVSLFLMVSVYMNHHKFKGLSIT